MFQEFWDFLGGYWEWLKATAQAIFGAVIKFCQSVWAFMYATCYFVWWMFETIKNVMVGLVTQVADFVFPDVNPGVTGASGNGSYMAIANTFFPLDETLAFLGAYMLLVFFLTSYRLIKSWIPTLS